MAFWLIHQSGVLSALFKRHLRSTLSWKNCDVCEILKKPDWLLRRLAITELKKTNKSRKIKNPGLVNGIHAGIITGRNSWLLRMIWWPRKTFQGSKGDKVELKKRKMLKYAFIQNAHFKKYLCDVRKQMQKLP